MKGFKFIYLVVLMLAVMVSSAFAIPELQLYVEGGTYDTGSETWVTNSSNFKLWVLGDVEATIVLNPDGTIKTSGISDVHLVTAFLAGESGTITLTPTTTSAVTDPSTPGVPVASSSGSGNAPTTGDGTSLQDHGIYGAGIDWVSYAIGNFTLMDSPIGDYITSVPTTWPNMGQINVYDVAVTGYSMVHFDAYDHFVLNKKGLIKYTFAPFSHDAETNNVPEPGMLALLGMGLVGFGFFSRRK